MITIMTDSTACLKESEAADMGVRVIPIGYSVDGKEYLESFCDKNGNFETTLKEGTQIATLQPGMETCVKYFNDAVLEGGKVLCITISSRLSGIYSLACAAAQQFEDGRITVFDSLATAGGLLILVKKAYEMAASCMQLEEIIKNLESMRSRVKLFFSVLNISHLRNSGRIGFVRRSVETILNVRPVLALHEGTVVFDSTARGNAEIIKRITRDISPAASEIIINYLGGDMPAEYIYNHLNNKIPDRTIKLRKFGPVLAVHLGLSILAVAYL